MGARWLVAVGLVLALGACTPPLRRPAISSPPANSSPHAVADAHYAVGVRVLRLQRGPGRPLPTLIFYPAAAPRSAPADGRFPLVLFSHGLSGSPERYAATLAAWAAKGFVVAAPRFPYTSQFTRSFRRGDIVNQPADVRFVLQRVRRLDVTGGDPLRGRIDVDRVAAVGHSAGGYTTTGLFVAGHAPWLRAGVVMAGWAARGAFAGPPAEMLFLQGTADPIVPVPFSRRVYAQVPWTKSYLLLRKASHGTYLLPGGAGYRKMQAVVVDFLRWTLRGDEAARARLPRRIGSRCAAQWAGCIGER